LALRDGPVTGAVQDKSQLQEDASKLEQEGKQIQGLKLRSFWAVQKATFGSMGCRPRARSVLHCHCVLALRDGPLTGGVQDESQLQEGASKLEARNTVP